MSNEQQQGIKEVLPPNVNLATPSTLDATVKTDLNMAPGVSAPPMLPPALMEYARKVSHPFFVKSFNWTTTQTNGTSLVDFDVSPLAPFWDKDFVPYFAHEAMKWAYYRGSFLLKIVFLGSAAYRGSVMIVRTFSGDAHTSVNVDLSNNVHFHSIDGGNLVHTHHLRFSARGAAKLTVASGHPVVSPTLKFQDIYYEKMKVKVISPLSAPSIYPTTVPALIILEPLPDIEFFSRRNNLLPLMALESEVVAQLPNPLGIVEQTKPEDPITNRTDIQ